MHPRALPATKPMDEPYTHVIGHACQSRSQSRGMGIAPVERKYLLVRDTWYVVLCNVPARHIHTKPAANNGTNGAIEYMLLGVALQTTCIMVILANSKIKTVIITRSY